MAVLMGTLAHTATDHTELFNPVEMNVYPYATVAEGVPTKFKFDDTKSGMTTRVAIYAYDPATGNYSTLLYEGTGTSVLGVNTIALSPVGTPGPLANATEYGLGIMQSGYGEVYAIDNPVSQKTDKNYTTIDDPLNNPIGGTGGTSETHPPAFQVESDDPTGTPGLPSDILQFEGAAQVNLTGLQVFMTKGTVFWGTVIHDNTTATTDATGRYAAITPTSGAVGDSVLLYFLTSDGKGVVVPKTLEDIS